MAPKPVAPSAPEGAPIPSPERAGAAFRDVILREFTETGILDGAAAEKLRRAPAPPADASDVFAAIESNTKGADSARDRRPSALCLSGGGIRSATFNLGVLGVLARKGILARTHFLSTVSGGGYIGGWFSAWRRSAAEKKNAAETSFPPGPAVEHLRRYGHYLSPRLGLLSADTWTLAATYLRNLLFHWLLLIPFFVGIMLLPVAYANFLGEARDVFQSSTESDGSVAMMIRIATLAVALIGTSATAAYAIADVPGDLERAPAARFRDQGRFILRALTPLTIAAAAASALFFWPAGHPVSFAERSRNLILLGASAKALGWFFGERMRRTSRKNADEPAPKRDFGHLFASIIAGTLGGIVAAIAYDLVLDRPFKADDQRLFAAIGVPTLMVIFGASGWLLELVTSSRRFPTHRRMSEADREWRARAGGWILIVLACWLVVFSVALYGVDVLDRAWARFAIGGTGTVTGAFTVLIGALGPRDPEKDGNRRQGLLLHAAAIVFSITLLIGFAWIGRMIAPREHALAVAAALVLISVIIGFLTSVNMFSMQALYRLRIVRAYLGATRERAPHPFTGFDPADDFPMSDLPPGRPLHVINVALNLVHGADLAWQQRKAESFTISRLHAGAANLGYVPANAYGADTGISLGTAIAVSGAAASPNMGYHSSPLVSFLLAFFNVRLGAWMPNPRPGHAERHRHSEPRFALWPLLGEALGLTNDERPYVYLSDGGHFENLGIYEMVRRRARSIIAVDAGADPDYAFFDLGAAVEKVRVDFGVTIEFEGAIPFGTVGTADVDRVLVGKINYPALGEAPPASGMLYVIKPRLCGNESLDVRAYAAVEPEFPQQSTADQFFDERQFESYRRLGEISAERLLAVLDGGQASGRAEVAP